MNRYEASIARAMLRDAFSTTYADELLCRIYSGRSLNYGVAVDTIRKIEALQELFSLAASEYGDSENYYVNLLRRICGAEGA